MYMYNVNLTNRKNLYLNLEQLKNLSKITSNF